MKSDRSFWLDIGLLWLRVGAGVGIAYHGHGKIFGGHMDKFIEGVAQMGFPSPEFFGWAAALSEFAGGILLAVGLFGRYAACFIAVTMGVAIFIKHVQDPLKVKELALAYFVISSALVMMGPGTFSLDGMRKRNAKK